jgi:hypothetical protein
MIKRRKGLDKNFADIIQLMVKEQGKETLINGKAKKYLSDYCKGQFKKEADIFIRILNENCGELINNADNVPERKNKLMERIEEDIGLSPKVTAEYLDLLGLILKGDTSKSQTAQSAPASSTNGNADEMNKLLIQKAPEITQYKEMPDDIREKVLDLFDDDYFKEKKRGIKIDRNLIIITIEILNNSKDKTLPQNCKKECRAKTPEGLDRRIKEKMNDDLMRATIISDELQKKGIVEVFEKRDEKTKRVKKHTKLNNEWTW